MSATEIAPALSPAAAPAQRSAFEGVKEASRQLRGTIGDEVRQGVDHFNDQNKQLLKFHGSYQQEDRDARKSRRKEGVGKYYMFMVRCKIPGGRLTADQYLAVDRLAGTYANGTLRFTTRQGIQLHGVLMTNLKPTIAEINACLLTTLGACGDVNRNVMACPAPIEDGIHAELQETATLLAAHLAPRTTGYHEIWLNGERVDERAHEADIEPIYGKVYLPRKFKIGVCLPEDNCVDIYAQDLGLLAVVEDGRIAGYNVLVGGGMGMTHGNANTFPFLGKPICYVPARAVLTVAESVVKLFRDHGNRGDRKRARIKYVVFDWGVEKFRQVLSEYVGAPLYEPLPVLVTGFHNHVGWHAQGNGKWYYGISVENGRVKDEGTLRLRSALRTLMEKLRPSLRITPCQDLLLCDLDEGARAEIERTLTEHGVRLPHQVSTVRQHSMACPAIPTCGLAITESERVLPAVIDRLEAELQRLGLQDEKISVRMTGCPNGCARPYQSDIGLVGRSGDKYTVYVGGGLLGDHLNFVLRDLVPQAQVVPTLVHVLEAFQQQRQPGEGFGAYCRRLGVDALQRLLPAQPQKPAAKVEATASGDGLLPHATGVNGSALVPEAVAQRVALPALAPAPDGPPPRVETFLAGLPGEELPDYAYRYHSDGSVRETVIFFYGDDVRAAHAHPGVPLRREATYAGKVNPFRLHAVRKLSDTYYVGSAGQERRDRRIEYHPDGSAAQTVVFFYDGDCRAKDAPSGAALRRQICLEGTAP